MGKRTLYGIDDYVKDKQAQDGKAPAGYEAAIRAATPSRVTATPQGGAGYGIRGGSVYIKPASEQQRKFLTGAVKAPEAEAETPSDGLSADTPMTKREMMYQNVVNAINSASQNLLDVMNRQFEYDEKSSPLYSILQKQYEREAELARGRAYASASDNAGGYGSSYATMAGEAARRQVMAGLDDQQLALYEAAKQEFEAERQSALDWYNTAVGMRAQAAQLVDEERLMNAARSSGMNEDTYNLMIQAANEGWYDGTNKESVRARLNTIAAGNPEINVDAIMSQLTAEQNATVTDAIDSFEIEPTLSGAAEVYAYAKQSGTLERDAERISAGSRKAVEKALKDASGNEEAEATALAEAAEAVRNGYLSVGDYQQILIKKAKSEIRDIEDSRRLPINKAKDLLDIISGILIDVDEETINMDAARTIIDEIAKTDFALRVFEGLPDDTVKIGQVDTYSYAHLNKAQEEAMSELGQALYRTGVLKNENADAVVNKVTERFRR